MSIKINNIKADICADINEIKELALKKISCTSSDCTDFKIVRRSLDARKKQVCFVYSVVLSLKNEKKVRTDGSNVLKLLEAEDLKYTFGTKKLKNRPVIIGSGPCGLFCALTLARNGYMPLVLERGEDVDSRTKTVDSYFGGGKFNQKSNIQFGEGGAGTFSDGKLTTRINDRHCDSVLRDFVAFGADPSVLINAKPHIGTDILKKVVKNIRLEIIRLGGEFCFSTKVCDFLEKNGRLTAIKTSDGDEISTDVAVLAIGHSARDTYKTLFERGIKMEQKPFSVGARIEHRQSFINEAMYGDFAFHPLLGAADYSLSYRNENRGCYSFCMCPGGTVVAANSEENSVVTNGMSEFHRDGNNANSAICVSVSSEDFGSNHPLAGIDFQRSLEQRAFYLGGKNYAAPVQKVTDFLDNKITKAFDGVLPSYPLDTRFVSLDNLFPENISRFLADGLRFFDTKIKGFTQNGACLTAPETRTSAPLRITRNDGGESVTLSGLYPSGEGAGYAGGIMSAAVDGIKTAEKIISAFAPFSV